MGAQLATEAPGHAAVRTRVFYNAVEREITFTVGSTVEQCDAEAVTSFQIATSPHTLGLYREDGITELLPLTASIARVVDHQQPLAGEVGIHEGEKLILRPSTVRGG